MPIYEYYCNKCQQSFEKIQKTDDRFLPLNDACSNCNEKECIELKVSSGSIIDSVRLGVTKPSAQFRERMNQIQKNMKSDRNAKIKDY
jgi:putative FmdB family regulatory protein